MFKGDMFKNIHSGTVYKTKGLEKPKCQLTGQRAHRMWHIHTVRCTAVKGNNYAHTTTWMDLSILELVKELKCWKDVYNSVLFCKVQKQAKLNTVLFQHTYIWDNFFKEMRMIITIFKAVERRQRGTKKQIGKCRLLILSSGQWERLMVFTVLLYK